ncbi:receptor-type adenylate cyclase, putative [Trypanosoma cruzi marinkellei]|uniref:Receptor-type adenylate cyclase, putative n=1 Tax=Trypanosoma cruzi marinkellei TaxID=85056 RepID=K2NCD0_TRYCR|nr:receptor-type adenylate cyclase, putative [Trypanosoma cruzi marinkellei]
MAVGWVAVWPREQRACAAARCLIVALLLLLDLSCVVAQSSGGDRVVKVLMLNVTDLSIDQKFVDSLEAGLESALWSRNFTVADGVRVEIIRKTATMQTSGVVIGKALNESSDILLVAGVIGDTTVANSLPVIMRHGLVSFAPFTSSSLVRGWNPNLYFCVLSLRPSCWHSSATPWPICVCVGWASCTCREAILVTGSMRRHNA